MLVDICATTCELRLLALMPFITLFEFDQCKLIWRAGRATRAWQLHAVTASYVIIV